MSACYIAGPMRGIPEYNYPAFMAAAEALRNNGWEPVYNPAELDIEQDDTDYTEFTIQDQKLHDTARAARRFCRRDTRVLHTLLFAENGDAIVMLPGWENSVGATTERSVAIWVKLAVMTIAEALSGRREEKA